MGFATGAWRRAGPGVTASAVFLIALVPRLVVLWQLHGSGLWDYLRLDPLYYHEWALRIAAGRVLADGTFEMAPLYAYGLGGLFSLFGPSLIVPRLVQALMGAATSALAAFLGASIFSRPAGWAAGLLMAFYGPALFHESQIMKTGLTMALTTATAAALWRSGGSRPGWLAAGGALLGLTALSQENINVTIPVIAAWIAFRSGPGRRLRCLLPFLASAAVAIAPATIHNYAVSREFVLVTSGGGEVFYTGNNPAASGHYRPPPFVRPDPFFEHQDFRAEAARRLGRPLALLSRRESDAFWWSEGMRFIRENPGRYLLLVGDKLATWFTSFERPDNYSIENFRKFVPALAVPLPVFGLLIPPALLGLVLAAPRWRETLPLLAALGAYLLSALLFFTQSRYRMPMAPLLAVFAGHGLATLSAWSRAGRWRALAGALAALAVLAAISLRRPEHSMAFDAQNHGILGEMALHAGRPAQAVGHFERAIGMLQGYAGDSAGDQHRRVTASSHFGLAMALALQADEAGRTEAAQDGILAHLRAAAAGPDLDLRADAQQRAAAILSRRGDHAGAAAAWAEAIAAGAPGLPLRLLLAEALHRAGRPDEALAAVEAGLAAFPDAAPPDRASAHYGMALILMSDRADAARAAHHLRETLKLNPDHPRAGWIRERLQGMVPPAPEAER